MTVLVIGAGPSGARVAERAAERGLSVTLVGEEASLPYDRVTLGRALSGEVDAAALVTHDRARLDALGIEYCPGVRIASLDRLAQVAITTDGERIGYDAAVLATGSRAVRLPLAGADLPGVFLYRTLDDVHAMVAASRPGARAVVIGGGLLGLEAAACLLKRGLHVTVVHPPAWPMERQLCEGSGELLAARLRQDGIAFAMPAGAAGIEGATHATGLRLADGSVVPGELIVMAVGVRPDATLARESGLPVGRGVIVDDAMRTADPAVLAVGECAEHRGVVCGLAAPALAMAEAAAATLAGQHAPYAPRTDAAALKVSGVAVWSGGQVAPPDADAITLRDPVAGQFRRLWLRDGRLVGAVLYGDAGDAAFYLDWIGSGRAVTDRAGLALGPAFLEAAA